MSKHQPPKSANDAAWQVETSTVTPLGQRKPSHTQRIIQPPADIYHPPTWKPRTYPLHILSNTATCQSGKGSNIPASLLKDLSRGHIPPTAWLDLHGFYEGDAWLKLMTWLHQAYDNEHRCVVIITGKGRGYGPEGKMGLIKAQTPTWLASHPHVQAFHTALPQEGGAGALYVYVQRRR